MMMDKMIKMIMIMVINTNDNRGWNVKFKYIFLKQYLSSCYFSKNVDVSCYSPYNKIVCPN